MKTDSRVQTKKQYKDETNASSIISSYTYFNDGQVNTETITDSGSQISKKQNFYTFVTGNIYNKTNVYRNSSNYLTAEQYIDKYGNLVKEQIIGKPNGTTTSATYMQKYDAYDYIGNRLTSSSMRSNAEGWTDNTRNEYDYAGRVIKSYDTLNKFESAVYNGLGLVTSKTDRIGNTTSYSYNNIGKVITETTPIKSGVSAVKKTYYDKNGNISKEEIPSSVEGATTITYDKMLYKYDNRNRLIQVTQYENNGSNPKITQYAYDMSGNKVKMFTGLTSPVNTATETGIDMDFAVNRYQYNYLNHLKLETDAMGKTVQYKTDFIGNATEKTDRNGITTTLSYNAMGKVLTQTATKDGETQQYSFAYDYFGNVVTSNDTSYTYDDFGRLITETSGIVTKSYTYDISGNRKTFVLTKGGTTEINQTYAYDYNNRLTTVTAGGLSIATYGYDNNGNLTAKTTGGNTASYSYNYANLLTSMSNKKNSTVLSKYDYTYYLNGNQATKADSINGTTSYNYDGLGRLKNETATSFAASYIYDDYGNRKTMMQTGNSPFTVSYDYDKNNRLLKDTKQAGDNIEVTDYSYDGNGNLLTKMKGIYTPPSNTNSEPEIIASVNNSGNSYFDLYQYDFFGRMTNANANGKVASYNYNAMGQRTSKTVDSVATKHIWDGSNIVEETDANNVTTAKYYRGMGLIQTVTAGNTYNYLFNARGDVTQLANTSGTVMADYRYDAFGNQINNNSAIYNPFRYCGEYTDLSSGLIYLRARYYDPATSRFISEDTNWNTGNMVYGDKEYREGEIHIPDINAIMQSSNLYIYALNNPLRWFDPSGKAVTEWDRNVMGGIPGRIDRMQEITDNWDSGTADDQKKWREEVKGYRDAWRNSYEYTDENGITRSNVTGNEIKFRSSTIEIGIGKLKVSVGYSFYNDGSKSLAKYRTQAYYSSEGMFTKNTAGVPKSYLIDTDRRGKKSFIRVVVPFSSKISVATPISPIAEINVTFEGATLTVDFKDL